MDRFTCPRCGSRAIPIKITEHSGYLVCTGCGRSTKRHSGLLEWKEWYEIADKAWNRRMTMKIKLDPWALMPRRAHDTDAGLDLYSPEDFVVKARGSYPVDTGVYVEIPEGYAGFIKSKSGLNFKYGIQSEGVVDCGYTGPIMVKMYNHSDKDYAVRAGDKITQLVILPILTPELELVDDLDETERGAGGFGSSGR